MTKSKNRFLGVFAKISLVALAMGNCSPALPGSIPAPKDFQEYSIRSENALAKSQEELKKARQTLDESRSLLVELKKIKAEIDLKNSESKRALSQSQANLKKAEREKRNASQILSKVKEEKQKIAEAPTPEPTPSIPTHSVSDAP